jgi:hypothetical protein
MPKGVAVKVRLGEHVSAGQTVLAEFRPGGTSNEGQGS